MQNKKLMSFLAFVAVVLLCTGNVYARGGGGGGFGGGRGGGGWSGGGRGGFGSEGRGGDFGSRGGEMPGYHGSGEYHGGGQGDHGNHHPNNNNNNNNNNNYYVNGGGWDGGWGYGAADDALAGVAMGTMIGAATAQPSTVIVEQPTTVVQQVVPGAPPVGTQVTTLPGVCTAQNVSGTMAYQCGAVWYRPFFGANGVYYQVVPPPPAQTAGNSEAVQ